MQSKMYQKVLEPVKNGFLQDHQVGVNRVLPATCAVNWMVEAGEQFLPEYNFYKLENFKVLKGVVFDKECPTDFQIRVKKNDSQSSGKVSTALEVKIESSSSRKFPNFHYSGTIFLSPIKMKKPIFSKAQFDGRAQISDKLYSDENKQGILFHGKNLQGVNRVLNISSSEITSLCRLGHIDENVQGQFKENTFNPYTADVQLHNMLIWLHQIEHEGILPSGFGQVEQFESVPFNNDFYVSTQILSRKRGKVIANITVYNELGEVFVRWKNAEFTGTPGLKELLWGTKTSDPVSNG